ncbi:hypothetical protein BCE_3065 [Bacillus cereus ATCC 10987]|uniref:Uncharacterized protein n=1 Tax=Bacillus cereus (strain ATCC 10987 / NRS 248) TaxID=222523 RepID=Q735T6_BACC1|nr:hypothetical protein BCE_3065 [Bacillus cereus ATCC 10987]
MNNTKRHEHISKFRNVYVPLVIQSAIQIVLALK